jgi:WD40 repeat protein
MAAQPAIELEHAIGCNVGFRNVSHLHPNGKDYVRAVGCVLIVGSMQDPHEQHFLMGHDDFITCVAVSDSGRLCATGQQGKNADVILWSLDTKKQVCCFQEQDNGIDCVTFSHDERFLISCGDAVDGRVFVYDTSSCLIIAWANLTPKPTISICAGGMVKDIKRRDTHEHQFAACGGMVLSIWHLDSERGELVAHPVGSSGKQSRTYMCMAFSRDYEYLFAGSTTGDVAVVLMKNRVVQCFVPVCSAGVLGLICLPTQYGYRIFCGGGDATATIISGAVVTELREENKVTVDGPLSSLSLSGDASEVLAVSNVGSAFLVRCKDLSVKLHNQVSSGALHDVAYPRDISDMFLTCCGDGIVTLWDANDYSAKLRCPMKTRSHPTAVAASVDILVAGGNDGRLQGFDMMQGQPLWQIDNAHKSGVTSVKLASNVRFVASGGGEGDIRIWELRTREMASHFKEHQARITDLQLFPNDQYAISVSRDRCLLTWDLRVEKRLTAHREKHGGINCLAVASNQTTVITAGQEKTLTYWDLRAADPIRTVDLDEEVMSVSLSPDNRYLATGGTGMVVKLWDTNSGGEVSRSSGHSRSIQKLSFSPDGKQIVSVAHDHAVLVWNMYS